MDKITYRNLKNFQKFSNRTSMLPHSSLKSGVPIKNVEFADFAIWDYKISVDIVSDAERIPQTREVKGSFLAKAKSLENIGWMHLYVFEEDVAVLEPLELFDYIHSVCEPHFESQLEVIATADSYRADQLEYERNDRYWKMMTGTEKENWLNDPEGQAKRAAAEGQEEDMLKKMESEVVKSDSLEFDMDDDGKLKMIA